MKATHKDKPGQFPTVEEVAARLRAEYAQHTPEQREIFGAEPSQGTILGEWIRIQSNHRTREEVRAGALRAMSIIYGGAAADPSHDPAPVRR